METSPAYIYGLHPTVYRTGETATVLSCVIDTNLPDEVVTFHLQVRFSDGEITHVPLADVYAGKYKISNGNFNQDEYNMWHHRARNQKDIGKALEEACAYYGPGAAMFWWKGVTTPIKPGDTPNSLFIRWSKAEERHQQKHP